MDKEEFIARYHPDTRKVFKNEAQGKDLQERLDAASKDGRLSQREREGVEMMRHEAEKMGAFNKKVVVDRAEGDKVAKKLEEGFKYAFRNGILKEPTREDARRARGEQ